MACSTTKGVISAIISVVYPVIIQLAYPSGVISANNLYRPDMSGSITTYEGDPEYPSVSIECRRPSQGWGDAQFLQVWTIISDQTSRWYSVQGLVKLHSNIGIIDKFDGRYFNSLRQEELTII